MHPEEHLQEASSRNGISPQHDELGKIRDILFGAQSNEFSQRILDLEQQLLRETTQIRQVMDERLQGLETSFRQEMAQLRMALSAETNARGEALILMERNFRESMEEMQSTMDDTFTLHGHKLTTETQQRTQAVEGLAERLTQMQADKTDRKVLSLLLNQMAEALSPSN
ncbi:MAG: hypothetical protein JNN12_08455 [Bacteroidetes Order II. Incertae sedis bacterium]|nr:hypothetical protein [Bacteroidetes Order II. bacterium]